MVCALFGRRQMPKGEALFERPIQRSASSRGRATGPDASSTLSTHSNSSIALSKKSVDLRFPATRAGSVVLP